MYKKLLSLLLCTLLGYAAFAQTYYQVTATSGTQNVGGKTVTITSNGSATVGNNSVCGFFYYKIGFSNSGGFSYSFSNPINKIRLMIVGIDSAYTGVGDTISISINGLPYTINPVDISLTSSGCPVGNYPTNNTPKITGGMLTGGAQELYSTLIQLDIQPSAAINSIAVNNIAKEGILYNFYFADTSVYINQPYNDTLYCPGDSLFLPYSIVPTFSGSNIFTAQLSDASGSFSSPLTIGSLSSTTAGTIACKLPQNITPGTGYRVRITSSSPARTSPDNGTDIHIKAGPTSVPVAGSNGPLCAGATLNLTSTSAGSGVSYTWSGPASGIPAIQNPSITNTTTAQSGDYIVTAAIGTCARKDTVTVQVKPLPATPTATNNGPLCPGETLNLQGNSSTPGVSYNWSGPVSVPPVQNPSLSNVTPANDGIYTLSVSLNGCTAPNTATTTVTIKPVPAVPTASSNSPVCTGGILNLTAGSITPGVSYDWSGPNNFTSTQQNPVIDPVPAAAAGTYEVSATLNGCTSAKGSTTVAVNTLSYLGAYASPNDTICEGSTLTVVTVPTNGGSSPAFQWFKNNNPIAGATKVNYATTTAITGDTFYCRMIAGNICNTPVTLFSNKIGITVQQKTPIPWVSISSNPARPIPGNPVIFTATPTNGGSHPQYQWQRNGTDIAGATSDTWSSSGLNPYDKIRVRLTVAEPCPDGPNPVYSDSIEVNFPQSIGSTGNSTPLYLYPNPSNGDFVLEGQVKNNDRLTVEIINYLGQTVYREQLQPEHNIIHKTLQLHRQLAPGAYLLKAEGRAVRFVVY